MGNDYALEGDELMPFVKGVEEAAGLLRRDWYLDLGCKEA